MKRDASLSPPPIKRRRQEQPPPRTTSSDADTPPPRTIRIFAWNINGIQPFIPASAAPITSYFKPIRQSEAGTTDTGHALPHNSLRAFLSRHNWPEVLFLQELKISPASGDRISAALLATLNAPLGPGDDVTPERSYTVDMVLPRDRFNAKGFQGKLYGVGTILRTDFVRRYVTRVRDVDWDLEGRVSVVETRFGDGTTSQDGARPLALINVYAVNGTSAPYKNPETGRVEGTRHDHKLAFHSRLRDEALAMEARGFDVVIAGDLNVARGLLDGHPDLRTYPAQHCRNRADFNAKFFGKEDNERAQAYLEAPQGKQDEAGDRCLDGVDVFRALHGSERRYTYHGRTKQWGTSADRVDLIITSRRLWEEGRVRRTDILDTPQERGPSDHVPLWVEVTLG
ncbi:DNase I-like protein [Coniochaeta ligniaria NRRL 30616]|uniref:DNase I-like protein n=1 Tax=Coniochaeta ligniaria NRRL 30616 TaxID=1408157 RepID=A0A1J7IKC3_9PEZI|nr:DNase I-like protein [Coniochaeta ligniaria NRRL 30616]